MLARVKQDYLAGPVTAFSGREYVRGEWREVPAGFEEQARSHPLLEVQPSLDEIRADAPKYPGLGNPEPVPESAVTVATAAPPAAAEPVEPPVEEDPAPKTARIRRGKRAAED